MLGELTDYALDHEIVSFGILVAIVVVGWLLRLLVERWFSRPGSPSVQQSQSVEVEEGGTVQQASQAAHAEEGATVQQTSYGDISADGDVELSPRIQR